MILMWRKDFTWAIGRVGLKVSPVLGPNHTRCRSCDFRAQNRLDFQQNPSNAPSNVNPPHKNHKAPCHIINSLINSYNVLFGCTNVSVYLRINTIRPMVILFHRKNFAIIGSREAAVDAALRVRMSASFFVRPMLTD